VQLTVGNTIHIDKDHQLVVANFTDDFDAPCCPSYIDEIDRLWPFEASFNLLVVFDDNARFIIEGEFIRRQASRASQFAVSAQRVVVASQDVAFGLGRLYASTAPSASEQYKIMRTLVEATDLLGMRLDELKLVL
jgi:hypothetical protein